MKRMRFVLRLLTGVLLVIALALPTAVLAQESAATTSAEASREEAATETAAATEAETSAEEAAPETAPPNEPGTTPEEESPESPPSTQPGTAPEEESPESPPSAEAETAPVEIDIKPGSDPNSINLGSNGVVPVAILGSESFDAATVNSSTVELAGATVRVKGKSGNAGSLEDVNGDGYLDLVVQVYATQLILGDGIADLTGLTYDLVPIHGTDSVRIVPE